MGTIPVDKIPGGNAVGIARGGGSPGMFRLAIAAAAVATFRAVKIGGFDTSVWGAEVAGITSRVATGGGAGGFGAWLTEAGVGFGGAGFGGAGFAGATSRIATGVVFVTFCVATFAVAFWVRGSIFKAPVWVAMAGVWVAMAGGFGVGNVGGGTRLEAGGVCPEFPCGDKIKKLEFWL